MNEFLLNLGPFNDCIDKLEVGAITEVCTPMDGISNDLFNTFHYSEEGVAVQSEQKSESIVIPTFELGMAINHDTPKNRQKLIRAIELKILAMIYSMAAKFNIELNLQNIVIPVKLIDFDFDSRGRLCIMAVLGIAIFEDSTVEVSS